MANINVYGTFNSMAEDQTVAKAAQIYDDNKLKNQQTINQELEEKIDNLDFNAENIGYDRSQTPDLGNGDVQSAIEALDGKVEAVDARIDDEKVEFIKTWFPSTADGASFGISGVTVSYNGTISGDTLIFVANTKYRVRYTTTMIPKGSVVHINLYYTTSSSSWTGRAVFAVTTTNPADYVSENGSIVGLPNTIVYNHNNSLGGIRNYEYYAEEDCWLILNWQNAYGPTYSFPLVIAPTFLQEVASKWYKKGVADGSGMASIVGLGYNIFDYITGAVNMEGFEYGVEFFKAHPTLASSSSDTDGATQYTSGNASLVYFPKCNVVNVKHPYGLFYNDANLVVVPDLTFNVTASCQNMFSRDSKLRAIGKMNGLVVSNGLYMFPNTTSLQRIEELDITPMVLSTNTSTANMFRSSTYTSGCTARYILFKGLGYSSMTTHYFANATYWGVNNADNPDALQSLIDTLYTYSADRSEGTACTIYLSTNSKNALNSATIDGESAIEKITSKGYTIA